MVRSPNLGPTFLFSPTDLDEFLAADDAVVVDVVEGEGPLQLVLRRPLRDHREELHEVPEGDPTGPVPEDEVMQEVMQVLIC